MGFSKKKKKADQERQIGASLEAVFFRSNEGFLFWIAGIFNRIIGYEKMQILWCF